MEKSNRAAGLPEFASPWMDNANPIWLATAINVSRNLDNFFFPGKLNARKRSEIIEVVGREVLAEPMLADPVLIQSDSITPKDKEYLHEQFLTSYSFHQAHGGEGFIVDSTGRILVTINLQDHLQFRIIDCSGEIENTWNRLIRVETRLGKKLKFAFSETFGFLTADPSQCGTALRATAYLQVPALIHTGKLEEFLQSHKDLGVLITGLQGKAEESGRETIGDLLSVHNNYTLGLTEENVISTVRGFSMKLMVMEMSVRAEARDDQNAELKDKVSRAYGILAHSYQIEAVEAMNALSLMKLGLDLEWVEGVSALQLNSLFFNCRRSHLLRQFSEQVAQEEIPHKRAEHIHQTLQNSKLTI